MSISHRNCITLNVRLFYGCHALYLASTFSLFCLKRHASARVCILHSAVIIRRFAPNPRQCGLNFFLESGDEFAVCVDERLLGFDFGDNGLLFIDWWHDDRMALEQ